MSWKLCGFSPQCTVTADGASTPTLAVPIEEARSRWSDALPRLEDAGVAYLAMKYVDGPSFDALLRQPGGIEARRSLAILHQVAEALDYVAERDMVHRDVKPANVLLGPGDHAYLSDFGIALESAEMAVRYFDQLPLGKPKQGPNLPSLRLEAVRLQKVRANLFGND